MQRLAGLMTLADLLQEMQAAAEVRDSDRLDALQAAYRLTSTQLAALPLATPDDPDAGQIAQLARQILERQAALESLTQPWMDDLRLIFREQRNEEVLASAYRQGG